MGKVENEGMPVVRLDRQLKYQGSVRCSLAATSAAKPLRFSVVILVFAFVIQLLNLLPAVIDVILACEKRLFCLVLHR